jgi:uncharacterized delta-60 repeat protein
MSLPVVTRRRYLSACVFALFVSLTSPPGGTGAAGDLDFSFGTFGVALSPTAVFGVAGFGAHVPLAVTPDDRLLIAGYTQSDGFVVARFLPDGQPDPAFGNGGVAPQDFSGQTPATAVVVQSDTKLLVAVANMGTFVYGTGAFVRLFADGSLDTTFGSNGVITTRFLPLAVRQLGDGKLVAAGIGALGRFLPDGTPDPTFGVNGVVSLTYFARALAVAPDGGIVVGGYHPQGARFVLGRYLADGQPDPAFAGGASITTDFAVASTLSALVVQPDGAIVAAGGYDQFSDRESATDFTLVRYLPDGSLDATFGTGGKVVTDFGGGDGAEALALLADGKLVAAGVSGERTALARYLPDGSLDPSFGVEGKMAVVIGSGGPTGQALVQQSTGKLVTTEWGGVLARFLADESTCPATVLAAQPQDSSHVQATTGEATSIDLAAFRRFRANVLATSSSGRRLTALYYAHGAEVARLLVTDPALRATLREGLLLWQGSVAALAEGRSRSLEPSADQRRVVDVAAQRLKAAGSRSLRAAIENEERRVKPGQTLAHVLLADVTR